LATVLTGASFWKLRAALSEDNAINDRASLWKFRAPTAPWKTGRSPVRFHFSEATDLKKSGWVWIILLKMQVLRSSQEELITERHYVREKANILRSTERFQWISIDPRSVQSMKVRNACIAVSSEQSRILRYSSAIYWINILSLQF
jgi:hypothetical protein